MASIRYTAAALLALNRHDVTPPRAARKVIFNYRLWRPSKQRQHQRRLHLFSRSADRYVRSPIYGCINIRSVNDKFDDVMELFHSHQLTVLTLTETWHDKDSPVFGRCRDSVFSVVDCPRPRTRDDLSVNHGGVAVLGAPGTTLSPLSTGPSPSSFEVTACCVNAGRSRAAVAVVYRPGSQPITAQFFDDLTALLERLVVLRVPLYVTGDFNIRLDRDISHAEQLRSQFESFGL